MDKRAAGLLATITIVLAACSGGVPADDAQQPNDLGAGLLTEPTSVPQLDPTVAPSLSIQKTSLTASVSRGNLATVKIVTAGGASCSIDVEYDSGPSTASGLVTKHAGSSGAVAWSWRVGTRTALGSYPIFIICSKGDRIGELDLTFSVRK